ncbi:MAG: four-carbon acid sugar kinase family protein, partial [Chloroflexota bacterium]
NDIGIMFAKSGCLVHVYAFQEAESNPGGALAAAPDIAILDTNSRLDDPHQAYEKVFAATRLLQEVGCTRFFNKTCSVFRGNIGAEFDAMLDALGADFAVVVLGFPKNGRLTIDGIHYVHGKRLEESEFARDPVHPMTRSSLVEILSAQTHRKVDLIDHNVVSQGAETLRRRIDAMKTTCNYLILDVTSQHDLKTIAQAVRDEPVLCGSSALAEELPEAWGFSGRLQEELADQGENQAGILCVAGSLMPQTKAQIEHLETCGATRLTLDTLHIFDPAQRRQEIQRLVAQITPIIQAGRDVILHALNRPDEVARTKQEGERSGLTPTETSRLVSTTLAEVTAAILEQTGQNRLIVAGGETSAAVCDRLGIRGLRIWKEIQPGLPSCLSLSDPPILLVLKSGSFGSPDFLEQAIWHAREESRDKGGQDE